jgi:peptide/nickel transport system substrate-binding protein
MFGHRRSLFIGLALLLISAALVAACAPVAGVPPTPAAGAPSAATSAPNAPAATQVPAAAATSAPDTSGKGGSVIYGMYTRFDTLDPTVTTFSVVGNIGYHLNDPLVWQTAAGEFAPGLAESWTISDDGKEYTLKLRQDVTFHDGTPLNAEAVKFTFDRIMDPETKSQTAISLMGPYESSEVVDDYTIKIKFTEPFAPFLNSLSLPYLSPQSPTAVEAAGKDYGITTVVGTGPYMFESYTPDQELVLVKNPNYTWGPPHLMSGGGPFLDTITIRIIPEDNTRSAALQSGELTFADTLPTQELENLSANTDLTILSPVQAGSGHSVMMNVTNPPMDDVKVRQALEWATDKQGLIDTVYNGAFKPACSPMTSNVFGYDPKTCDTYQYDPDKAGTLLDEAGWTMNASTGIREKDGQPLKLGFYFRGDSNPSREMATFLQNNWKQVGVDLDLQGLEQAGYFDAVRSGKHHAQFWWETATDPDVVRILFHSANADGGTNRNRYKNPEMDELIDAAAAESDSAKRAELYAQIQAKALDEAIMIFLADPLTINGMSSKLKGVMMDWGGNYPFFHAAYVEQ